jgi:hypothetical protein
MDRSIGALAAWLLLVPAISKAQQLTGSAGGEFTGTTSIVSFSIGEPVTATAAGGAAVLTQGFQQPWADVSTVVGTSPLPEEGIVVYPNPARHVLYISAPGGAASDGYELVDTDGRLVISGRLDGPLTEVDMTPWAAGAYLLRLSSNLQQPMGTFRITVTR